MNELIKIKREINRIDRNYHRVCTYYALSASFNLERAVVHARCARPTTLKEAQNVSKLINTIFGKNTTPYEFMHPVDQVANESVEYFEHYRNALSKCMFDQRILDGFAKWYVHSGFETAFLKCNIGFILYIGLAMIENANGTISKKEMDDFIENVMNNENNLFSFNAKRVKRAFSEASLMLKKIEDKILIREYTRNLMS